MCQNGGESLTKGLMIPSISHTGSPTQRGGGGGGGGGGGRGGGGGSKQVKQL